jgi:hypothetical protein
MSSLLISTLQVQALKATIWYTPEAFGLIINNPQLRLSKFVVPAGNTPVEHFIPLTPRSNAKSM